MKLVIRYDDFGYSNAVNEGILEAASYGLVSEVGVMINMPYATYKLDVLKSSRAHLGLHSNISVGCPILNREEIPSLVDERGRFHSSKKIRMMEDTFLNKEDIKKEIKAQIQAFKDIVGYDPTYVDVHAVPNHIFLAAVKEVAYELDCLYIDTPLVGHEIHVNDVVCNFVISPADAQKTCEMIENMTSSDYGILVLHPGYVDEVLKSSSSLVDERVKEVEMLVNGDIQKILDKHHIQLIYYEDIHPIG